MNHEKVFVLGPSEVGKSFVACALAQKACRNRCSALYTRAAALFRDLALTRADGSLRGLLAPLSRIDVLVIDDWAMAPPAQAERRDPGKSARTVIKLARPSSCHNYRSRAGTSRSVIPPPPPASSTAWFTTPIALRWGDLMRKEARH